MVDDDGNLELRVTEHQVLPCQTDRRTAWWAVILAMASCVIMVNACPCGVDVHSVGSPAKYQNIAGQSYFTGTPFQSSLGAAWSTMDWVQSETERLGMVLMLSWFVSFGTSGIGGDIDAASTAQMRTFGQNVATRYLNAPNMMWHVEGDGGDPPANSTRGRKLDYLFRGITETQTTPRLIFAEPQLDTTAYDRYISQEGTDPTGYQWLHLSANSLYSYASNSTEVFDTVWAQTGATTYPVWDCEPPYVDNSQYTGNFRQQVRERNFSVFIRGGCAINYGDESWWPFDQGTWPIASMSWVSVPDRVETVQASYAWALLAAYCAVLDWAPDTSMLTTGLGSGDTKASSGKSSGAFLIYFPSSRTVTVDTTVISGTANVRLRWYDPTAGTFSTVAASEAQQSGRSVSYPGNHADGTSDYVLVVDLA